MITTTDNLDKVPEEMQRIESRAAENNLVLNKSKTTEIVFHNRGKSLNYHLQWTVLTESPNSGSWELSYREYCQWKKTWMIRGVGGLHQYYVVRDKHSEIPLVSWSLVLNEKYSLKSCTYRLHGGAWWAEKNCCESIRFWSASKK